MQDKKTSLTMLKQHINSETPIIWINTHEYERAIKEIERLNNEGDKERVTRVWSLTKLIYTPSYFKDEEKINEDEEQIIEAVKSKDPMPPIVALNYIMNEYIVSTTLILLDFHRFLQDIEVARKLLDAYENIKESRNNNQIIIVSPVTDIPPEIEKYIVLIDFPLPSEEEIEETVAQVLEENSDLIDPEFAEKISNKESKEGQEIIKNITKAGKGLTLEELKIALTLSINNKGYIDIKDIFEQKKQLVKKTAGLEIFDPEEIDEVKGLERAKEYITKAIKSGIGKGSLLVGIPGTGKSLLAKQIGRISGLPTIILSFGDIFGSLVGESERKISHALKTVEAMAPCILFIDEIEKGISGINSSDRTDGGTGSRVFGKFLTWLNDKTSGVYVIATANDISKIPPEFLRSGRWNWIFFVDLPTEEEGQEILKYYCEKYKVEYKEISVRGYTGAEIKAIVENAYILNCSLEKAKESVIPIAKTRKEDIEQLREYAKNRFIPASYTENQEKEPVAIRKKPPRVRTRKNEKTEIPDLF